MDTMPGFSSFDDEVEDELPAYGAFVSEDAAIDPPPLIGNDERRMQVRAYNFWTSQLGEANFPNIEELDPEAIEDFRDNSVLLDFTSGIENPSIPYIGASLRKECALADDITYLDQVPPRSLLSRITDHYMQIIANRAPIGFEAEFVNEAEQTIMYRGILLPYSSDDDTIDFIYGVINWKEGAPKELAETLELEVEDALAAVPVRTEYVPVWADGPTSQSLDDELDDVVQLEGENGEELTLAGFEVAAPDENSSLAEWLDAARGSADFASDAETRSREALYRAISRAYDFSLAAERFPQDFAELLADNGLIAQDRAPMTPIVKLIFGVNYDKTRLTEYAAALDYAHRNVVPVGRLGELLSSHDGGLKGIVQAERRARKVERGDHVAAGPIVNDPRPRLRAARARSLDEFASGAEEFVLLVARRDSEGGVAIIGAVADAGLTEKALTKAKI